MTDQPNKAFHFSEEKLALLDLLLADEGLASMAVPTISPRLQTDELVPLSFAQQRLWFLETLTPGSTLFNTPLALRLTGQLNEAVLAQACQALVQRHESLRTTFTAVSGTPYQHIHENWPIHFEEMELQDATAVQLEAALQTAVRLPFDLEKGPLLRFTLCHIGAEAHILLLVFHHIVFDGWSAGIIIEELTATYDALCRSQQPELPDLPIQYADYALWQRDWLTGEVLQTQLDYWQNQLAGELPVLQFPTDKPRPTVKTHNGAFETISLSPQLTAEIKVLCQQTGSTPFMLLLAAFKVLLHRYTAQDDILVGTPIANRQQAALSGLVGFFVNTLVLRSQLDGWQSFRELLVQVRDTATAAYDFQDVPFEKLVELLQPKRTLNYDPLFQVMFTYEEGAKEIRSLPNLSIAPIALDNGMAQFDLTLSVTLDADRFQCSLNYNTDLFMPETMRRLLVHWQNLLQGIVAKPDSPIGRLPLLTPAECQQIVVDWNRTEMALPASEFSHELIAQWATQKPDAPALIFGQQQMSYAELDNMANQLAHALQAQKIGPEKKVGVFLNRSFEMVVAVLAVFKVGGAYVPLDPAYPAERLNHIVADADLAMILTTDSLVTRLPEHNQTLCLDRDWERLIARQAQTKPFSGLKAAHLAYVIYTSGSTGRPKGVGVTHRGLVNLAQALGQRFEISEHSRVLQFASFSFDASVAEMLTALQNGATLVLADADDLLMGASFVKLMNEQGVTVATLPPSALALLSPNDFPMVETIVSAGEACSEEIVAKWSPGRRFVNGYGPTEGTVGAVTAVLTADDALPVIGRPLPNYQVYLLNPQLQPVPVGVAGEIHIGGIGLARGYLNQPALTAEKFIPNPFTSNLAERLYKTGDLGRYLPDGRIEFLGRIDHQVKIRGFRIELGEVEAVLRQHPTVQDVLVLARENGAGDQLVAYVVGDTHEVTSLRPFLSQSLPAYMIPSVFVPLKNFPLTPNGKIDRHGLPDPSGHMEIGRQDAFVAPQDALESQLAQIWQQLLNMPAISTDANYFDLGGHSLQAVTLFDAIEKKLEVRLPVSLLFQAPTIGQLASAIRQQGVVPQWSSLVPIQPLGRKTPLFCVHGGAGHIFHYRDLAELLGKERPFYGLQPKLDHSTQRSVYRTVEEMAAHYIEEMKMVQSDGPYLVSGFCFGGIVAYEIAQQLRQAGDEVGLLAFIDPSTPQNKPEATETASAEQLAERLTRHKENMARLGRLARLGYILNSSKNRFVAYKNIFYRACLREWRKSRALLIQQYIDLRQLVPSRFHDFYFMHVISTQATQAYYPQRYAGKAVLFHSTLENGGDESLGWSDLPQDGLQMHPVEATHLGILKRPFIDVVAEKLGQYLEPFA